MNRFVACWCRLLSCASLLVAAVGANAQVIDGPVPSVALSGFEHADVLAGADVSIMTLAHNASVDVRGGIVGTVVMHEESFSSLSGGDVAWIWAHDKSVVRLSAGASLSWLVLASSTAHAYVLAQEASYASGQLSGRWLDGSTFSFWAVDDLANMTDVMPANITIITAVPEPGTYALMLLGVPLLLSMRRISRRV